MCWTHFGSDKKKYTSLQLKIGKYYLVHHSWLFYIKLFSWGHFRLHSQMICCFYTWPESPNSYYIFLYVLFETLWEQFCQCQNATHRTWHNDTRSKTTPSIRGIKLQPTTKHLWHPKLLDYRTILKKLSIFDREERFTV